MQRSFNLLNEICKYNNVDLLAFHQPDLYKPIYSSQEAGLSIARTELGKICKSVEFIKLKYSSRAAKITLALTSLVTRYPYNINWLKSGEFGNILKTYLSGNKYDLIMFDTISLAPYLSYIGQTPSVLDHHNIESHMLIRRSENEGWNLVKKFYFWQEGKRLEQYEKKICPKFSANITCSDLDSNRLLSICNKCMVSTIPNGIDTRYFRPHTRGQAENNIRKIIFIGRLSWYPNIKAVKKIALKIWPRLKIIAPDITADIIGASPPRELVSLAAADSNFRVHGFVDDILPYMAKNTIYICPIDDGGGTKLKVLDALAMGMPIVAHPIACEGIDVSDGKDVLLASSTSEFVEKIKYLIDNPEMAFMLGDNARKLAVDKYSYETIGKKLNSLFEEVENDYKN